ncbi:MAG: phosphate/phosphite/phosphonate ABC transporter substrate-binding protein [Candidatus Competibacterales bacterium]
MDIIKRRGIETLGEGTSRRSFGALALGLALGPVVGHSQPPPRALSFGVVPQQAASTLARLWSPLLAHLSQTTGLALRFRTAPDIPTFERRLGAGEYDLAYMNPYHYTVFHRKPGYRAFARAKDRQIRGIVVVGKVSPIEHLHQLAGATLAFPAPAAFAASLLVRSHLKRQGIPFTPAYVASHDSVYRTVARGLYPAGGGIRRTFDTVAWDVRSQLRTLWTTPGYTPHAFAAHPRVPHGWVETLTAAMVAVDGAGNGGQDLLRPLGMAGFRAADNGDWDDIRALEIDALTD